MKAYDVVIVGGGVVGSASAHYLRKNGFKGTIALVEKDTSWALGCTARSVGGLRQQFSTPENIRLSKFGVTLVKNLKQEFGPDADIGFTLAAFVHEDRAEARRLAGPGLAWAYRHILDGSGPLLKTQIETDEAFASFRWMVPLIERPVSLPALEALGLAIVGTPDDLVRHLEKLVRRARHVEVQLLGDEPCFRRPTEELYRIHVRKIAG
jgi:L-2-hydroxyglutarate oxidase LhgO